MSHIIHSVCTETLCIKDTYSLIKSNDKVVFKTYFDSCKGGTRVFGTATIDGKTHELQGKQLLKHNRSQIVKQILKKDSIRDASKCSFKLVIVQERRGEQEYNTDVICFGSSKSIDQAIHSIARYWRDDDGGVWSPTEKGFRFGDTNCVSIYDSREIPLDDFLTLSKYLTVYPN